jgi:hypothetical protein
MEDATFSSEDARSNGMKSKTLVAMTLLAACTPALAAQQIAPVQVTAAPDFRMEIACENPARPSRADVVRLLDVRGSSNVHRIGTRLLGAVHEACVEGVPAIAVHLTLTGDRVVWAPLDEQATSIASN